MKKIQELIPEKNQQPPHGRCNEGDKQAGERDRGAM
jgi:hypothetical protein